MVEKSELSATALEHHLDATPRVTRFGWTYAPGDKVIHTINDYDKDTFNGDIGQVLRVALEEGGSGDGL